MCVGACGCMWVCACMCVWHHVCVCVHGGARVRVGGACVWRVCAARVCGAWVCVQFNTKLLMDVVGDMHACVYRLLRVR